MPKKPTEAFRISPQQERIYLAQQGCVPWRAQLAIDIEGPLDTSALQESIKNVVERHEILRTTFWALPEMRVPCQVITDACAPLWDVIHVKEQDPDALDRAITRLVQEDGRHPCDLQNGPLLRLSLLVASADRHVLLVCLPSLCADGETLNKLFHEITGGYGSCLDGTTRSNEPPLQYLQFSEWQHELLERSRDETGTDFWRRQNISGRPRLKLPFEREPSGSTRFEPDSIVLRASPDVVAAVDEAARRAGISGDVCLLACWLTLLWRLSWQPEIVVGKICDGRKYRELDEIFGPMARCLPVLCRFEKWRRFDEVLRAIDVATRDAYEWQDSFVLEPSAEATSHVNVPAYFPFAFEFQTYPEKLFTHDVSFLLFRQYHYLERFSLKLKCLRAKGSLITEFHYDSAVFGREDVRRVAEHFHVLLGSAFENPRTEVDKLNILSEAARHDLVRASNQTDATYPKNRPYHHLFEDQAVRVPDRVAVTFQDQYLTYDELNRRANQLAHHLRCLGARTESLVPICVTPCLEMIAGILGILKTGGAFVPLDPTHPRERLASMLAEIHADFILTLQPLSAALPPHQAQVVCLDTFWHTGIPENSENPAIGISAENLAYVIHTSGSTGKPKGTMISHRGLVNYLSWSTKAYTLEDGHAVPLLSSITVDLSVTSLFAPLMVGQSVLVVLPGTGADVLSTVLRSHKDFSLVKLTPSHARVLRELLSSQDIAGVTRTLVIGGESLQTEDISFWQDSAPETLLFNEYGPTETVVGCCVYRIPLGQRRSGAIPIGRPISNTSIYVLDDHLEAVPPWVSGEIYVSGEGLARGYFNEKDRTAEKFIPDPFGSKPGARMYRTGDAARRLPDGNIEFLGRSDQQVKIRGFRVELEEIEAALKQHVAVGEVAVLATETERGDKRLVAFVVPLRAAFTDSRSLVTNVRKYLGEKLPEYMVPASFLLLQNLPVAASGKVDRRALASLATLQQESGDAFAPPLSMEEEVLAGIWTQVLGLAHVGIDDNYFALGGDSIRSIQVVARAQSRGLTLSTGQLFKHQTIRKLARELTSARAGAMETVKTQPFTLIRPDERSKMRDDVEDAYPLTRLQAGMIFHREYSPTSTVYHDIFSFHLKAQFDVEIFRSVVAQLVNRHPVLRASFDLANFSEPLQLVHRSCQIPLQVDDLRGQSPNQQDAAVAAWIESEKRRGFDVTCAPLWRFQIHRRTEETIQFTFSFHHAILDGWSDAMMITELFRHYLSALRGTPVAIEPPAATFRDFVALEQLATVSKECKQYWAGRLRQGTFVKLPRWQLLPGPLEVRETSVLDVPISDDVSEGLKRLALSTAVPIKTVLLAAHMKVMSLLSGSPEPLTCVVSGGRPETTDGESVLGIHINSIPFGVRVSNRSWTDLIRATFETELESLPFRRFPTAELKKLDGAENLSETVFYFTHYHVYQSLADVADINVLDRLFHEETSFTLVVYFRMDPFTSRLSLSVTYDTRYIGSSQINAIANAYTRALAAMAAEPQHLPQGLSLLSDDERHQLLMEWNDQTLEDGPEQCIHERFEAQAEERPDAVAVVWGEHQWTYEQLNQRANQLAGYLVGLGAGPEVRVGLCLERGLEMVVGIVGILKAGGVYVPLDPSWPPQRLATLLTDAQVQVLVSRQSLAGALTPAGTRLVCWDREREEIFRAHAHNPDRRTFPAQAAYVIYTSGSSGAPKGVVVSHANVTRLFDATDDRFRFSERDVWTLFHSFGFDFSVWELWGALMYGGRLVVVSHETSRSPAAFQDLLCREGVTVLNQTPSAFRQLLSGEALASGPTLSVERVILGGEAVDLHTVKLWWDRRRQPSEVVNMYGITETTVHVTYRRVGKDDLDRNASPIGRPIADLQVYLLDEQLEPVPIGVTGELYVGGSGLARGYLHRPDLTADRFIPHKFSTKAGARLYRSGDVGRYLPQGEIEYLGRIDDQVKVRGFRVEPAEIETVLAQHPAVGQALVVVREFAPGDTRLVAYLTPDPERALTVQQLLRLARDGRLTAHVQYELPNGMVVVHKNKHETDFTYHEIFEGQSYLKHGITITNGDCVFDVGANIGLFTLFVDHICTDVTVYAFEPIPAVFEALHINTDLYACNVKLFNCGLSNDVGMGTFTYYPHVSIFSGRFADTEEERAVVKSFLFHQQSSNDSSAPLSEEDLDLMLDERLADEHVRCPLTTISEMIRENGVEQIDLLKIDAEKSEFEILAGIEEDDWPKIKQVVVEVHDIDRRLDRICVMLRRHGFDLVVEQEASLETTNLHNIYAIRSSAKPSPSHKIAERSSFEARPTWSSPDRLIGDVQRFVKARLPDYMVPGHFVLLEALPLTPNGKPDRHALPAPDQAKTRRRTAVTARTPVEETLVRIWTEVFRVDSVDVHDNFFEVGGDSILSIQVTAKAKQAGLHLTPKQLFDHPTIAGLARTVATTRRIPAWPTLEGDSIALSPIQHWFFDQHRPDPHHFNQALVLEMRPGVDRALLERSAQCLLEHHDALRMRFVESDLGWRQFDAGLDKPVSLLQIDLSALPAAKQQEAMELATAQLQASLNLATGPLLRIALFDFGVAERPCLVLIIHHLVVDVVSWRILLADLEMAYQQLKAGEAARFPAQTASFRHWSQRQREHAKSDELLQEVGYWLAPSGTRISALPKDYPHGLNSNASARVMTLSLTREDTRALLLKVTKTHHVHINDVFLTALLQVVARWTGTRSVLIDLEGHGRVEDFADVELSRTVGWLTVVFPVHLDLPESASPEEALRSTKEQLRRIPNQGLGYGLLRYLRGDADIAERLRQLPQAEVSFNYLGQVARTLSDSSLFEQVDDASGPACSPKGNRKYLLEINGRVTAGRLHMSWTFSENVYRCETIQTLAQEFFDALRSFITRSGASRTRGATPSGVQQSGLDRHTLNLLAGTSIEATYPLTPTQQGMLFHTLYDPQSSGYVVPLSCRLRGNLDQEAFERAWQHVIDRHPTLRTSCLWESLHEPLQVVHRRMEVPLERLDWQGVSPTEQANRLDTFIQTRRAQGTDLSSAPLMHLALIRLGDHLYQFVWTFHHILLDGWSIALLLKEVGACYEAFCKSQAVWLESRRPYREYVAWLGVQDLSEAEAFWRQSLKGFSGPPTLALNGPLASQENPRRQYDERHETLSSSATAALQSLAKRHQLTLNTFLQGAWSLVLSDYTGAQDVVFGVTTSGRSIDLEGVESMVGLLINTLPARVRVLPDAPLLFWLKTLQEQLAEIQQYEYSPLSDVQKWSEVPRDRPLFESILVFENYPAEMSLMNWSGGLEISDVHCPDPSHYPLTVTAALTPELLLRINFDGRRFNGEAIARMLADLVNILLAVIDNPHHRLNTIMETLNAAGWHRQIVEERHLEEASRAKVTQVRRRAAPERGDTE